jgi:hypothetical protein
MTAGLFTPKLTAIQVNRGSVDSDGEIRYTPLQR